MSRVFFSKKLFLMNMYNLHVKLWILKNKQFKSEVTPLIIWSAWGHGLSLLFYDKYLSVPKNIMWLSKNLKCAKTMFDILKKRKGNSNQMNSNCHQYTCMITKYNNKNNVQTYYIYVKINNKKSLRRKIKQATCKVIFLVHQIKVYPWHGSSATISMTSWRFWVCRFIFFP